MFIALAFLFSAVAAYCAGFFYLSAKKHRQTINQFASQTMQIERERKSSNFSPTGANV